jgi:hypothetical protein
MFDASVSANLHPPTVMSSMPSMQMRGLVRQVFHSSLEKCRLEFFRGHGTIGRSSDRWSLLPASFL